VAHSYCRKKYKGHVKQCPQFGGALSNLGGALSNLEGALSNFHYLCMVHKEKAYAP
jgi:hypothetical protein